MVEGRGGLVIWIGEWWRSKATLAVVVEEKRKSSGQDQIGKGGESRFIEVEDRR